MLMFIHTPFIFFFFNDTATTEIYTLSLHDALPISRGCASAHPDEQLLCRIGSSGRRLARAQSGRHLARRSEEHTSELQSPCNLVCRLLLEKKKNRTISAICIAISHQHDSYRDT